MMRYEGPVFGAWMCTSGAAWTRKHARHRLTSVFLTRHFHADQEASMQQGFCRLPKFFSPEQVACFRSNIADHVERLAGTAQLFDDGEDQAHGEQEEFLASGDKIIAMVQPEKDDATGKRQVFKLGHGLHIVDPLWRELAESEAVKQLAIAAGYDDPVVVQSQALLKEPGSDAVTEHQDSSFLITQPDSLWALWIALDYAGVDNGCLWVVPGQQPITRYYERQSDGQLAFRNVAQDPSLNTDGAVPLPCRAGDAIAFRGDVVHFSPPNTSQRARWAITLHFASSASHWAKENWLQCPSLSERMC